MAATEPTFVVSSAENLGSGVVRAIKGTNRGSLRCAEAEPFRAAFVRDRYCYSPGVVANASAPVTDMPTTAAAMCLYNADPVKSLFIEKVMAHSASGTMGLGEGLIVCKSGGPQAAAVANGTGVVSGKLGGGTNNTLAKFGAAITLTSAGAWITVATAMQVSAVQLGAAMIADLDGLIEIPPLYCLGMSVLAPAGTTAKYSFGVVWSEWTYTEYS
jgi:hypothetical protein